MTMMLTSYFAEMHLGWWFLWMILIVGMFFTAYEVPVPFRKKRSPRNMIHKRIKAKERMLKEYYEKEKMLMSMNKGTDILNELIMNKNNTIKNN